MKKVQLTIELTYDDVAMYGDDIDAKHWFLDEILYDEEGLSLHSDEIGDFVGSVKVLAVGDLF